MLKPHMTLIIVIVILVGVFYALNSFIYNEKQGNNLEGWLAYNDEASGFSFQYPKQLSTKYIVAFDWPPKLQVLSESFTCTEAGVENERAGKTERRMIDGRTYCVTKITEGAAGSIYTQYAYATEKDGKTVILTFTTRAMQCRNYEEGRKLECEREREAFDLDGVVERIMRTIR